MTELQMPKVNNKILDNKDFIINKLNGILNKDNIRLCTIIFF